MNALKRWIVRKEITSFVDNAIKESTMSAPMKSWLIGALNAIVSGVTSGGIAGGIGVGWKHSVLIAGGSALVSFGKWVAQHPLPGAAQ
jgi:hypothetical protein